RAGNAAGPWPEFAENTCYGCHRDLKAQVAARTPGSQVPLWRWNEWYFAELPTVMVDAGQPEVGALARLRAEMGRGVPRRDVVGPLASQLSGQLADWLRRPLPPMKPAQVRGLLDNRLAALTKNGINDWDVAAQDYLAAAALHHAMKDMDPQFAETAIREAL